MTYTPEIKAAREFAQNFGVKAVVYGAAGSAKTPCVVTTTPRPLVVLHEAGAGSLRNSDAPAVQCFTSVDCDDFYDWFERAPEANNYDTLVIDSLTQLSRIYLDGIMSGTSKGGNKVHGMAAYGDMAKAVMKVVNKVYFRKWKHVIAICQQELIEVNGVNMKRPFFPGQQLNIDVPHSFDCIFHQGYYNIPGVGETIAVRCKGTFDTMARSRFGGVAELEPPDYNQIIAKCMQ